jgi:hypothetical protein
MAATNGRRDIPPDSLLSPRSALILLLAVLVGVAVGALTLAAAHAVPAAVLAGGAAWASAIKLFHKIIGSS